jgi:uncharacterized membrane protein
MKKFIAPLIFGVLALAAISLYLFIFVEVFKTPIVMVIYILVVTALVIAMIKTLIIRYKEIKQEENDDISKY